MHNIPCVIFAGGKSSRMGRDKALLPFGGSSLACYQYNRLQKIFDQVYISTKDKKFDCNAKVIIDSFTIYAPTPAFLDIFKKFDEFFAISVDTPFVDIKTIDKIIEVAKNNPKKDAIIAKTDFPHPLIGIYRKSILSTFKKEIKKQNYKLNSLLKKADTLFVQFKEEEPFFNCNYPEDFQEALKKIC